MSSPMTPTVPTPLPGGLPVLATPVLTPATQPSQYHYKQQVVRVFTSAGAFIDVWRDAPLLSGVKFAINSATSPLRVQLPRAFDNFDEAGTTGALGTIAQGNIVQYWLYGPGLPSTGLLKFQGVIDSYQPQIAESGEESLTVTITPFDSAVGDSGIVGSVQFGTVGVSGTYEDPVTMFNWWFSNINGVTGHPYPYPLTLNGSNPASSGGVPTTYLFQNQSLVSLFETIRTMLPANWFWRVNQDKTVTLNVPPTTPQHLFVLGQHLAAPQYRKDWTQLRNVVQVQGNVGPIVTITSALAASTNYTTLATAPLPFALISGQNVILDPKGSDAITLTLTANASAKATSISVVSFNTGAFAYASGTQVGIVIQATATGSDISTFGYRLAQVADTRILDVKTAQALANGLLTQYDREQLRTTIRVIDYRGDSQTGIGYDIETIEPGDTCSIVLPYGSGNQSLWDEMTWDVNDWDQSPGSALSATAVIYSVSYSYDFVDIELGSPGPSQDIALLKIARAFGDYSLVV